MVRVAREIRQSAKLNTGFTLQHPHGIVKGQEVRSDANRLIQHTYNYFLVMNICCSFSGGAAWSRLSTPRQRHRFNQLFHRPSFVSSRKVTMHGPFAVQRSSSRAYASCYLEQVMRPDHDVGNLPRKTPAKDLCNQHSFPSNANIGD
jgi:hypothetical protein